MILEHQAKRQAPGRSDLENGLTHEIKCLLGEIEVQKEVNKGLREEVKGRVQAYE